LEPAHRRLSASVYVLLRSVPPLALITYIMLFWLGHSEAHRLIPIVYASRPRGDSHYHGVATWLRSTWWPRVSRRAGRLMLTKVLLRRRARRCSAGSGTRAIAWMTGVAGDADAETGWATCSSAAAMWASRLQTRSDPASSWWEIMALAAVGWAMDAWSGPVTGGSPVGPMIRPSGEAGGSSLSCPRGRHMGLRPRSGASACRPGLAGAHYRNVQLLPTLRSLAEEGAFPIESEILPAASR